VTPVVVLLVLVAAGLHAGWNVLLKSTGDPLPTATRSLAASALLVTPACLVAWYATGRHGLPALGWLVLGLSACAEGVYFVFLSRAYQAGDLSLVYPIARGTGPLVAVAAGLLVLHEHLTAVELIGVAAVLAGIWAVRGRRSMLPGSGSAPPGTQSLNAAVVPALITGVFIGLYTTLDRVGINLGSPWLYAGSLWGLMAVFLVIWTRGRPLGSRAARAVARAQALPSTGDREEASLHDKAWRTSGAIGLMMAVAYGLFLVALTLAPVAIAAPLRESAIVLVTAWGVWRLREREGLLLRLGGAVAIVVGIVLIAV
jgi:drug/metabolite transporter (DMT)-like permease